MRHSRPTVDRQTDRQDLWPAGILSESNIRFNLATYLADLMLLAIINSVNVKPNVVSLTSSD